jgi:hypothetical protein
MIAHQAFLALSIIDRHHPGTLIALLRNADARFPDRQLKEKISRLVVERYYFP